MSEHHSEKEPKLTKEVKLESQNPAILVKTPKLPVKVEFSQNQSEQQKPHNEE